MSGLRIVLSLACVLLLFGVSTQGFVSGPPSGTLPRTRQAPCLKHSQSGGEIPAAVSTHDLAELIRLRASPQEEEQGEPIIDYDAIRLQQKELRQRMKHSYVLIFNPGMDDEGIYTLWLRGQNIVLGFEDKNEAARYAMMLRAQEFYKPVPKRMETKELAAFCQSSEVGLQLAPRGSALVPPDINKTDLDFKPVTNEKGSEHVFSKSDLRSLQNRFEELFDADG